MPDSYGAGPRELITTDVTGYPAHVRQRILQAIEQVLAEADSEARKAPGLVAWTKATYEKAMIMLAGSKAEVQMEAVRRAILNGGSITRSEVYELGGYPEGRQLKGFTRPVNRATQALRDSGDLPDEAEELLEAIYDMNVKGYQQAKGFRVPQELVALGSD
jgi:hypothetical protein